ncbi:MAG TPA: 50S ribosomal protein L25 [Chitinispirillaceae bacterium]|nr:50S ribosomal protein L25 [Chitinispirillaceae bacterium]
MDIIKLKARQREGKGKSYTRKARAQGWVPAIYYGHNRQPLSIEVDNKEFATIVRNRKLTHVIDLGIGQNQDDSMAVIKEIQRNVIKDNIFYHIDFQHVNMNEKVTVEVPVIITGASIGVKMGGILGNPVKSVMVECMPMDIPERVSIDVTDLDIGQSVHVRDINLPNVTLKEAPEEVLVVVTHPTRETADAGVSEEEQAGTESASS